MGGLGGGEGPTVSGPKEADCTSCWSNGSSELLAWYVWLEGAWATLLLCSGVCSSHTVGSVSGASTAGPREQ